MKKLAVLALASVLSVSAYAQDNDNFVRQQPSHGEIPNLQLVGSERIQSKNQDLYVGEKVSAQLPEVRYTRN